MPEFAREDPHSFWHAADAFERKNSRAYTELQIALPRELEPEERHALAREATRELLGERCLHDGGAYAACQGQHRAAIHAPDVLGTGD
jgi:hypothetical protein